GDLLVVCHLNPLLRRAPCRTKRGEPRASHSLWKGNASRLAMRLGRLCLALEIYACCCRIALGACAGVYSLRFSFSTMTFGTLCGSSPCGASPSNAWPREGCACA
ncbi:hypothetical protein HAX54_021849, partial [Datura stramonium]|nr:hypothetical protein [Datura stramonium]